MYQLCCPSQGPNYITLKECHVEFFEKFNFMHGECLKLTLSKFLSFGIIAGSLVYKLPQILKISSAKSAGGISLAAVLLEILSCTFSLAYSFNSGFAFMTYGEAAFVAIFDLVIIYQILTYEKGGVGVGAVGGLLVFLASLYLMLAGFVPYHILKLLQGCVTPLIIISRTPQIWSNITTKSTGQLSIITWGLNCGGSLARVFTTLAEVNDPLVLTGFVVAAALNTTITLQILWYGDASKEAKKKKQ